MNLVIDYGNTVAKVGIFDHEKLIEKKTFSTETELKIFLQEKVIENVIVSSVNEPADAVASWARHASKKFVLTHHLPVPVHNRYATPATLGMDRLAGVCGASQLFPYHHALVIDAGTCITFDFIDDKKSYWGGSIAPGLSMRFLSMHTLTAKLPLVNPAENPELIGNNTEASMQSGVVNGMTIEISGIISQYREKYADLKVILCGGDARFFEKRLKESIFASPDLVLIGLNSILIYNVKQ